MKKYLYFLFAAFVAVGLSACSPDEDEPYAPDTDIGKNAHCVLQLYK